MLAHIPNESGVYFILNAVNGRVYVGSAFKSLPRRQEQHWSQLRNNHHLNRGLQSDWNEFGEDVFRFTVLSVCPARECVEEEWRYIIIFRSANPKRGYNRQRKAGYHRSAV